MDDELDWRDFVLDEALDAAEEERFIKAMSNELPECDNCGDAWAGGCLLCGK